MKIRKKYETWIEWGLNCLYPHRCPLCHEILKNQKLLACPKCSRRLKPIAEPRCKMCGRPIAPDKEMCRDCGKEKRSFLEGRGIFLYTELLRKSIILYKYDYRREYGRFFAETMYQYAAKEVKRWNPDLLVPIPLQKRKQRQRGFNQAAELAEILGDLFEIKVSSQALQKILHTKSQKKLGASERKRNLKQAFCVNEDVRGLRILLIDDVFTTGSTIDAAAECLIHAGASKVFFLTLCIGAFE